MGLIVSPTWQAACSKAGAANPIKYKPAITLVTLPNQPSKGVVNVKLKACSQAILPVNNGIKADKNASEAASVAIGIAKRITHFTPQRLTTVKIKTIHEAKSGTDNPGRYHCTMADAANKAVKPQVGTQPHQ